MEYSKEISAAKKVALRAGKIIRKYFEEDFGVDFKQDNSPVTKADILVNELVISELSEMFPEDGIIGEEKSTTTHGKGRKWICDPLDGTAGYIWGIPTAMFSLALVIDGKPMLGVTHDPFLNKTYEGVSGNGSYCNGVRLNVSHKGLSGGHVAISSNPYKTRDLPYISDFQKAGTYLPTFSGAVYKSCLVARGKFEGYIEDGVGTHDMAAMQVIIEEAGGKITSIKGDELDYSAPFKGAIVSNGKIHPELVKIVNKKK